MDDSTGAFADINGLSLYYEIHWSGRPLVLLPGVKMLLPPPGRGRSRRRAAASS